MYFFVSYDDEVKVDACLGGAIMSWISKGRQWTWTVLESGMTILAAQTGKTLL